MEQQPTAATASGSSANEFYAYVVETPALPGRAGPSRLPRARDKKRRICLQLVQVSTRHAFDVADPHKVVKFSKAVWRPHREPKVVTFAHDPMTIVTLTEDGVMEEKSQEEVSALMRVAFPVWVERWGKFFFA